MGNENKTTLCGLQGHRPEEIQRPAAGGLPGSRLTVLAAVAAAVKPWPGRHVQSAPMSKYVWQMTWNPITKEMTYEKVGQRHERLPKVNVREVFDAQNRDILRSILRNTPQRGDLKNRKGIRHER